MASASKPATAELRFPFADAVIADAVIAAQIGDRHAGLMLLQNPDDPLFRKATALHAPVLFMDQSELQPGLTPRGNVSINRFIVEHNNSLTKLSDPSGEGTKC